MLRSTDAIRKKIRMTAVLVNGFNSHPDKLILGVLVNLTRIEMREISDLLVVKDKLRLLLSS